MIDARKFIEALVEREYSHYTGVPCSYLKPFINCVIGDSQLDYVGAASEGEAVGISLGAYLAGRKTVTMCQNSGLGNMVNPLTSLNAPFRIPTLLIVTWRGKPDQTDEPQHKRMGAITPNLLDVLGIPYSMFPQTDSQIDAAVDRADEVMRKDMLPYAFIMPKDSVAPFELPNQSPKPVIAANRVSCPIGASPRLTRTEAIQLILDHHDDQRALIATTGKTGRELFAIKDLPRNFYVVGGMGTAAGIGFGIAHALPRQPVTVLDGDGAALMKLGTLATIGHHGPQRMLHIILDNEQHDSTGGQQTVSPTVRFADIAAAANYCNVAFSDCREGVETALPELMRSAGPSLLHLKIQPGSPQNLGRPTIQPHEVKKRFMQLIAKGAIANV